MSEAAAHVPSERLSWEEICVRHVGEWVLLVDVDWIDDVDFEPRSAVLVAHSTNRRELPENIESPTSSFRSLAIASRHRGVKVTRFDPDDPLIVVPARLDGPRRSSVVRLAVDTGSDQTLI